MTTEAIAVYEASAFVLSDHGLPVFIGESWEDHISTWLEVADDVKEKKLRLAAVAVSVAGKWKGQSVKSFAGEVGWKATRIYELIQVYTELKNSGRPEFFTRESSPLSFEHFVAALRADDFAEALAEADEGSLSVEAVRDLAARRKRDKQIAAIERMERPAGRHSVIVADPPWQYEKRAEDSTHRGRCPYPTMPTEEICEMRVADLAQDDCILWLWTTNAFMADSYRVAEAWGFEVKTILTWAKDRMGVGDWLRGQTEHCLLAVKGKPVVRLTNQTTLLTAPMREHSRKPDEFYALVESLCIGSRCELFSREAREGWANFGAEIGRFE